MPRVLQGAPVDLVAVFCSPNASPATCAILQLAALVTTAVHLPVAEAGEARGGGGAAALRKEIAWQERGTCCCERVAILITEPPTAEANAEDL
eukprot:6807415-Prymnesium_polylepis.1